MVYFLDELDFLALEKFLAPALLLAVGDTARPARVACSVQGVVDRLAQFYLCLAIIVCSLESFLIVWKITRQSEKFPYSRESFQTIW